VLIKPSSALRNEYDKIVKTAMEHEQVVYITRNGEGEMVLMTLEEFERREAEQKFAKILIERMRSKYEGARMYTNDEVKELLKAKPQMADAAYA
jgi:prevent-host-death family protein